MEEKIATIILKVDLDCSHCSKKIRRTLCKLQGIRSNGDCWNIQTISYDEKNNTVMISGPFNPHQLSKKLCCKASEVIKEINFKEEKYSRPKCEPVPCHLVFPKPDPPKCEPVSSHLVCHKPDPCESVPCQLVCLKPAPPKCEPVPCHCVCPSCCSPCYEWYRCCSCGRAFGLVATAPPVYGPPPVYGTTPVFSKTSYDGPGPNASQFFCEEDQSCKIM